MDLLQRFEEAGHNGHALRPTTFWSWNDRLDTEELRRQIREMAKAGMGGHFMHARPGRVTPYLSPEWMEAIHACLDEAAHTDVTPWLYDEDAWPSGACSGRVYEGHETFQSKHLLYEEIDPEVWEPDERTVAVYVARPLDEDRTAYTEFEMLDDPRRAFGVELADGEALVHFYYAMDEYVDTLSRQATAEFLKQTYDVYKSAVGRDFGKAIPGMFTDEPQYGRGPVVPWSLQLPRFFERSTGRELRGHLPELFFEVGEWRKTRFDFYESVTRLFLLAWTMPVYQWCDRNELDLTGHVMAEDTLSSQTSAVGAAMPHYEYMHIPGIDHLGRELGTVALVKQAASVAAQLERPRVLSEMFGASGWNVSFDELRWMAEWQFVLGVDLVCQHLSQYSLRGGRKRDFPPSLHYHQPWWPHYYLFNDYVARLLTMLTAGEPVVEVLVIHPIASAWSEREPNGNEALKRLDERLEGLCHTLLGMHADFHFGDELILERHGRVEKGKLVVGSRKYRTVVVPDATNIRTATLRLLKRLRRSNGTIVFAGRVPGLVDGEPSEAPAEFAADFPRLDATTDDGRAELRTILDPRIEVTDADGNDAETVVVQWRQDGTDQIFFLVNYADEPVDATVRLPSGGTLLELDPTTGRTWEVEDVESADPVVVSHRFEPRSSVLYVVRTKQSTFEPWLPPEPLPERSVDLDGKWEIHRRDPNALVLDVARYDGSDSGEYGEPMYILDVQRDLLRQGSEAMVSLKFEFDCRLKDLKGRRFEIVLETPEAYEMWVGGMRTPLTDGGPYWDSAFRRVDITPYVRPGVNEVELRRPWHVDPHTRAVLQGLERGWASRVQLPETEIEAVYLVGDFAVEFPGGVEPAANGSRWMLGRPRLVAEPETVDTADLVGAGYPFFTGRMTLVRDVTVENPSPEAVLDLPEPAAITAIVEVNGQEAGVAWTGPRRVPVGDLLVDGPNRVAVTLTTSLRNLLGPLHNPKGELFWVSPGSFGGELARFGRSVPGRQAHRTDYNVVDLGLGGTPTLYY